jgi:hypothetical protein
MLDLKKSKKSEPITNIEKERVVKENIIKIQRYFEVIYKIKQNA